jgi:hypothetical protein
MTYSYGGRQATITIRRGGVVKGFYVVAVDVDEVDAEGEDVIGIDFSISQSMWLEGYRTKATTNQTTLESEVNLGIDAMIATAKRRFRDAVDAEALG